MTFTNFKVVRVVSRCNLNATCTKADFNVIVSDNGNLSAYEGKYKLLAYKVSVSLVLGMNGNGGITQVNTDFIIGSLSLVFWAVTLLTTCKYVLIAMKADNNGEGGIFSLYALVKKLLDN